MGVAISGLVAATNLAEADIFEIEQSGVSKKVTKTQLRSLLFSDPAFDRLARTDDIERIVVTDTIPLRSGAPDLINQLPSGQVLADCIANVFNDESVSEVFEGENQLF